MELSRRKFLHLAATLAAIPAVSRVARAQLYPSRPVRIIVGFPPGGANDLYARLIAQWLSERLGQQFVVENRPGAGGNIGAEVVARASPDGYTLLLTSGTDAWNMTLYDKLKFNYIHDIAPVARISRGMGVLVIHPSFPVKTIPEFIAYAMANPNKINMASGGVGSVAHIYGELFKAMTGVEMSHVPYRGTGPALADLLAGRVDVMFDNLITSIEHVRSGRLRALAVTDATRSQALPDIPTIGEFVPGYEASGWQGVGAPKNTPAEIVDRLNKEINTGLTDPKIKARIGDLGAVTAPMVPVEFGKFMAEETEKWGKVIRAANIKME
jgi:tripartite-type tricarboxylate transporter receptor subunit TctC